MYRNRLLLEIDSIVPKEVEKKAQVGYRTPFIHDRNFFNFFSSLLVLLGWSYHGVFELSVLMCVWMGAP